ncbi:uncharacterized protein METZ01_LOCUS174674 [marine metagenome]|uniref:Uncharacterized protein n=1 Tax=marine metagenome TaxID=408172 RepID=A0A382C6Z6_9ZZZZ
MDNQRNVAESPSANKLPPYGSTQV